MSETFKYGCEVRFRGGYLNGERVVSTALMTAKFPTGKPLAWSAGGWVAAVPGDYIAIALMGSDHVLYQSPMIENTRQAGSPVLPVAQGLCEFRMEGCEVADVLTLPFLATPGLGSWTVGDLLYISADGKWNNVVAVAGDPSYGEVVSIEGAATAATALVVTLSEKPTYLAVTGEAGSNGATFLSGAGVPGAGTGANGDHYLDTVSQEIYKKAGGAWASIGNIKGAAGQNGANIANSATVTASAGVAAGNPIVVTAQLIDTLGDAIAEEVSVVAYVSSDAVGATPATGPLVVGVAGKLISVLTANVSGLFKTGATGLLNISITKAAPGSLYCNFVLPNGRQRHSAELIWS